MIKRKTNIPILNIPLRIFIYEDEMELIAETELADIRMDKDPRDFNGGIFELEGSIYIMLCNDGTLNHGIVAHECKHVVNTAFRMIGAQIDIDNDEMECYFLTWVVNQVYKKLKIKKKK